MLSNQNLTTFTLFKLEYLLKTCLEHPLNTIELLYLPVTGSRSLFTSGTSLKCTVPTFKESVKCSIVLVSCVNIIDSSP